MRKIDNNQSNDFGISMHVIQLNLSLSLPLHGVSYSISLLLLSTFSDVFYPRPESATFLLATMDITR
jgi:hypothetical protein